MKMTITERIIEATTGIETVVKREETDEELTYRLEREATIAAEQAAAAEKATARQAVLDRLGLTAEEAALLLN